MEKVSQYQVRNQKWDSSADQGEFLWFRQLFWSSSNCKLFKMSIRAHYNWNSTTLTKLTGRSRQVKDLWCMLSRSSIRLKSVKLRSMPFMERLSRLELRRCSKSLGYSASLIKAPLWKVRILRLLSMDKRLSVRVLLCWQLVPTSLTSTHNLSVSMWLATSSSMCERSHS